MVITILKDILYTLDCEIFHSLDILKFKIDSLRNDINTKFFGMVEDYGYKPLIEVKEARILITLLIRIIEVILFIMVVGLATFSTFILTLGHPVLMFILLLLCLYSIVVDYITDGEALNIIYDKGCDWVDFIINSDIFKRVSSIIRNARR